MYLCRYVLNTENKLKWNISLKIKNMTEIIDLEKLDAAASKLRAIAHPVRIAILSMLAEDTRLSVTEIYTRLTIEQASASHHLNILKEKGLISGRRNGKKIFYTLKADNVAKLIDCVNLCGNHA